MLHIFLDKSSSGSPSARPCSAHPSDCRKGTHTHTHTHTKQTHAHTHTNTPGSGTHRLITGANLVKTITQLIESSLVDECMKHTHTHREKHTHTHACTHGKIAYRDILVIYQVISLLLSLRLCKQPMGR